MAISKRRITRELNEYRELARDIVRPPLSGWSYVRGPGGYYGEIHFVMEGEEYTVFDLVSRVMKPLRSDEGQPPTRFAQQLGILSSVVRSEVEIDIAKRKIDTDLYAMERDWS